VRFAHCWSASPTEGGLQTPWRSRGRFVQGKRSGAIRHHKRICGPGAVAPGHLNRRFLEKLKYNVIKLFQLIKTKTIIKTKPITLKMLNNISYEQASAMLNDMTSQKLQETADYLIYNYGEQVLVLSRSVSEIVKDTASKTIPPMVGRLSKTIPPMVGRLSEYLLDTVYNIKNATYEYVFNTQNVDKTGMLILNMQAIRMVFGQIATYVLNYIHNFMDKYNFNITLFVALYVVCLVFTHQMNIMRKQFNAQMEEMREFIDDNELEHLNIIEKYRQEFKKN